MEFWFRFNKKRDHRARRRRKRILTEEKIEHSKRGKRMNELYEAIEQKIKGSGYPREISGRAVYNDICDQIEGKDNGTYLLLCKAFEKMLFLNITSQSR